MRVYAVMIMPPAIVALTEFINIRKDRCAMILESAAERRSVRSA
jgi:hypothetical protein